MARTKKVSGSVEANIDETIQATIKEKYRKRAVERIHDEMKRLSEKQGRPFRNIDLARELGVDGSLVTKWFKNDAEIKDYQLGAMADLFHCAKSWIDGSGNARTHESYNSVIERTGLSEAAIEILIEKTENSAINYYPDGDYIDAINYLITEGGDFLNTFRIARKNTIYLQRSLQEHIIPYGLDDSIIAVALEWFPETIACEYDAGQLPLDHFKRAMSDYRFSVNGSEKRLLTDEELVHLYKHCQNASLLRPDINQWNCEKQLRKLFAAIEDSN